MTDFTDYLENNVANWMVNNTQMPTPPANPHVALHTADPTETGDTAELDPGTTSYERVSTAPTDWTITGGNLENANEVTFPQATESWGSITHATLWTGNDPAADDAYAIMELSTAKSIDTDDQLRFSAGNLSFSID